MGWSGQAGDAIALPDLINAHNAECTMLNALQHECAS